MKKFHRREVEFQEGIDFAKKHGFEFFAETSAVDGTNVETVNRTIQKFPECFPRYFWRHLKQLMTRSRKA